MPYKAIFKVLFILYIFIIPIYFFHARDSWIDRGNEWNQKAVIDCCLFSIIWPFAAPIEFLVTYQSEQEELRQLREWKRKL